MWLSCLLSEVNSLVGQRSLFLVAIFGDFPRSSRWTDQKKHVHLKLSSILARQAVMLIRVHPIVWDLVPVSGNRLMLVWWIYALRRIWNVQMDIILAMDLNWNSCTKTSADTNGKVVPDTKHVLPPDPVVDLILLHPCSHCPKRFCSQTFQSLIWLDKSTLYYLSIII